MKENDIRTKYKRFTPQFIKDKNGMNSMVILEMEIFENLIEDLEDLAVVADRRDEAEVSLKSVEARLKKNGRI